MNVTKAQAAQFVQAYLDAFSLRDLQQCLSFYQGEAGMSFGPVNLHGRDDLARWHEARFAANVNVVNVDDVSVENDVVRVAGKMTSNRLKTWRIHTISGIAEFTFQDGKVSMARFRMNPKSVVPANGIE